MNREENPVDLANRIWEEHFDIFNQFDLVSANGHDLEQETKEVSLFSTLITLTEKYASEDNTYRAREIDEAIVYLKGSKYYSEINENSKY